MDLHTHDDCPSSQEGLSPTSHMALFFYFLHMDGSGYLDYPISGGTFFCSGPHKFSYCVVFRLSGWGIVFLLEDGDTRVDCSSLEE